MDGLAYLPGSPPNVPSARAAPLRARFDARDQQSCRSEGGTVSGDAVVATAIPASQPVITILGDVSDAKETSLRTHAAALDGQEAGEVGLDQGSIPNVARQSQKPAGADMRLRTA
jgi:hypothetical protein